MSGFSNTVNAEISALMVNAWQVALPDDSRFTASSVWNSQGLSRANWENFQNRGIITFPMGIVTPTEGLDADADTPVNWVALRTRTIMSYVVELNDPLLQVAGGGIAQGTPMSSLQEYLRQQLITYGNGKAFRVYRAYPSSNVSQDFGANHPFYDLLDGKFAGHVVADILTADIIDPSNQ